MNERIRLLAEQAGLVGGGYANGTKIMTWRESFDNPGSLEKFAQLIFKECGEWFNNRLVVEPDYEIEHRIERNRAVVGVMKEFNQHFGVEE